MGMGDTVYRRKQTNVAMPDKLVLVAHRDLDDRTSCEAEAWAAAIAQLVSLIYGVAMKGEKRVESEGEIAVHRGCHVEQERTPSLTAKGVASRKQTVAMMEWSFTDTNVSRKPVMQTNDSSSTRTRPRAKLQAAFQAHANSHQRYIDDLDLSDTSPDLSHGI